MEFLVHLPLDMGLLLYRHQQSVPQPIPVEPAGYSKPEAVTLWEVPPRDSSTQHPQNAIDNGAMVLSRPPIGVVVVATADRSDHPVP
jgi:hypothetical protein